MKNTIKVLTAVDRFLRNQGIMEIPDSMSFKPYCSSRREIADAHGIKDMHAIRLVNFSYDHDPARADLFRRIKRTFGTLSEGEYDKTTLYSEWIKIDGPDPTICVRVTWNGGYECKVVPEERNCKWKGFTNPKDHLTSDDNGI